MPDLNSYPAVKWFPLAEISREEWRRVMALSLAVLALSSLPLAWGWLATPLGQQYTGLYFNAHDANTYLAKMLEGRQGAWTFHLAHTSESGGPGAVTFVFYLLLGKVAGLLGLPEIVVFHLARLLCGLLLLLVSYNFIGLLFQRRDERFFAFILVCSAAGLGWLLGPLGIQPLEFWVAEGFTFQSIFANPHFPLATALLVIGLSGGLAGLEGRRIGYFGWTGLAAFGLGFVHPFLLFSLGGVLAVFWLRLRLLRWATWGALGALFLAGLAGFPGAFLTWWGTRQDPLLKSWMDQNQTLSLDLPATLAGYGLLVPLALAGAWWVERPRPSSGDEYAGKEPALLRWRLVTTWAGVTVLLLFLPVSFSRRWLEGLHLPLCCLAAAGWYRLAAPRLAQNLRSGLKWLLVGIMAISSLGLVVLSIALLYLPPDRVDPVRSPYLSGGEVGAIEWLRQHSQPGEVVITGPVLGNVLPGRVAVRVFYGHSMETIDAEAKLKILEKFFDKKTTNPERYAIISRWGLKYLVYGWREQYPAGFDPQMAGWPLLYEEDNVWIYLLQ